MIKNIYAAILDMDGTLIDSMGIWHKIDQEFFKQHQLIIPENLSNQVNKMTMQEWAQYFIREFGIAMTEQQIIDKIAYMSYEYYAKSIPLKAYVIEFLDFLDKNHIYYGIATATYRKSAQAALKRLGILDRMQFLLTAEDVPSSKKNPEMFFKAAALLKQQPEHILVVEDALHCIQTAKSAGFPTAAVYDTHIPPEEWEQIKTISDCYGMDLHEIIKKIS